MTPEVVELVKALHGGPYRYALALTGGGTGALAWLLSVPGGSRTLLTAAVPYDRQALDAYLGRPPAAYCSTPTAFDLARRALELARGLAPGVPVAGVGCTAGLRVDRPKRGDHRFHLAVRTDAAARAWSLVLAKDARTRDAEEDVLDRVLLNAMAEAFGLAERVAVPLLPGEAVAAEAPAADRPWDRFWAGELTTLCQWPDGRLLAGGPPPRLLLPGSFNPPHAGHLHLARVAAARTGHPAAFELTVVNADKPPLEREEVRRRMAAFVWRGPLWLTRAPTFAAKARLFPGATFVVGADTAARVVQPRFYGDDPAALDAALAAFRGHGGRFLVAGRIDGETVFRALADLAIPAAYRDLFDGLCEEDFRVDLSSTQLRAAHRSG